MNWLRSHWSTVAVIVCVLAIVGVTRAWAGALGEAKAYEARADSLNVLVAELSEENARQVARVFARDSAYRADSLTWVAERAALTTTASVARETGTRTATALRARLDSIGSALLSEYEAGVQREREAFEGLLALANKEITALRNRLEDRDALIRGLYAEIDIRADENVSLRAANAALRDAVAPSFITRLWDSKEIVAVAFVLGAVTWEVAR